MRIPVAKEGMGAVGAGLAGSLACLAAGGRFFRRLGLTGIAVTAGLAAVMRDPDRIIIPIEDGVLAPFDGRVTRIGSGAYPVFGDKTLRKITIDSGLLDCHVQRAAITGKVTHKSRTIFEDGEHAVDLGCQGEYPVFLRARSAVSPDDIVATPNVGDEIVQGDRIGIAKFGTGCEIYFPLELSLLVTVGDRVWAGITALAQRPGTAS